MVKNLIKIVSYGKFDQVDNKHLYKRSNLKDDGADVKTGFLKFQGGEYRIYEARLQRRNGITNEYEYQFDEPFIRS